MTADEFAARAVGLPWVRWRSDWQACDCYGLVLLYWREVLGLELGAVPRTSISDGFHGGAGSAWAECGPEPGASAWMAWRDGAPTHCGVLLLGGQLLHAQEGPEGAGSVRITRLAAMHRLHPDIRFYKPRHQP